jgi:hypothetical protein
MWDRNGPFQQFYASAQQRMGSKIDSPAHIWWPSLFEFSTARSPCLSHDFFIRTSFFFFAFFRIEIEITGKVILYTTLR